MPLALFCEGYLRNCYYKLLLQTGIANVSFRRVSQPAKLSFLPYGRESIFMELPSALLHLWSFSGHLLTGAALTLKVAIGGMLLAMVIGLSGALGRLSGIWIVSFLVRGYIVVFRSIPEVIIVLALYFGGGLLWGQFLNAVGSPGYHQIDPVAAGVLALGLTFGAYATEIFRGAILAIPPGEIEAARNGQPFRVDQHRSDLLPLRHDGAPHPENFHIGLRFIWRRRFCIFL